MSSRATRVPHQLTTHVHKRGVADNPVHPWPLPFLPPTHSRSTTHMSLPRNRCLVTGHYIAGRYVTVKEIMDNDGDIVPQDTHRLVPTVSR